jgi:hypothetical protein
MFIHNAEALLSSYDRTELCRDRGGDYLLSSESASINATLILLTSSTNDLCLSLKWARIFKVQLLLQTTYKWPNHEATDSVINKYIYIIVYIRLTSHQIIGDKYIFRANAIRAYEINYGIDRKGQKE